MRWYRGRGHFDSRTLEAARLGFDRCATGAGRGHCRPGCIDTDLDQIFWWRLSQDGGDRQHVAFRHGRRQYQLSAGHVGRYLLAAAAIRSEFQTHRPVACASCFPTLVWDWPPPRWLCLSWP